MRPASVRDGSCDDAAMRRRSVLARAGWVAGPLVLWLAGAPSAAAHGIAPAEPPTLANLLLALTSLLFQLATLFLTLRQLLVGNTLLHVGDSLCTPTNSDSSHNGSDNQQHHHRSDPQGVRRPIRPRWFWRLRFCR